MARDEIEQVVDRMMGEQRRRPRQTPVQADIQVRKLQDIARLLQNVLDHHFYDFGPEEIGELQKMQQGITGMAKKYK